MSPKQVIRVSDTCYAMHNGHRTVVVITDGRMARITFIDRLHRHKPVRGKVSAEKAMAFLGLA